MRDFTAIITRNWYAGIFICEVRGSEVTFGQDVISIFRKILGRLLLWDMTAMRDFWNHKDSSHVEPKIPIHPVVSSPIRCLINRTLSQSNGNLDGNSIPSPFTDYASKIMNYRLYNDVLSGGDTITTAKNLWGKIDNNDYWNSLFAV